MDTVERALSRTSATAFQALPVGAIAGRRAHRHFIVPTCNDAEHHFKKRWFDWSVVVFLKPRNKWVFSFRFSRGSFTMAPQAGMRRSVQRSTNLSTKVFSYP
jgi:hypothetical protein